jgi:hypothetical protein
MPIRPALAATIVVGVGFLGFALGHYTTTGLLLDPMPCTSALTAEYHYVHHSLDDEGFSEAVGDFRRAGWDVETHKDGLGWHVLASCNEPRRTV